jgi:putative DNA primase/helicase
VTSPITPERTIDPAHLAELRASGLSDEVIASAGIYTERDPARLTEILGWKKPWSRQMGAGLVFPYRNLPTGELNGFAAIKPQVPIVHAKTRKPRKYEHPKGEPPRLYFGEKTFAVLSDASVPLLFTEGQKKALSAEVAGFPCIGLAGVFGWKISRKKSQIDELIPDFDHIALSGRKIAIAFDSDLKDNTEVQQAESRFAAFVKPRGAIVSILRIPGGPNGEKVGLDDFLVRHGADGPARLQELLAAAGEPIAPVGVIEKQDASEVDPVPTARDFIDVCASWKKSEKELIPRLRLWRSDFYIWSQSAGVYRPTSLDTVRGKLVCWLDGFCCRITNRVVADILGALRAICVLDDSTPAPSWLMANPPPFPAADILATSTGLIHVPSYLAGQKYRIPPTPEFFSLNALPFGFDPDAPEPVEWLRFLQQLWPNDPQSIATLQEWFGYCLTSRTDQQKILLLVGPQRCGKGTIARVIRAMVGEANVCGPTLSSLGGTFGLAQLLGKSLATISDARLSSRTDSAVIVERLLSISGEDCLTTDRKNKTAVDGKLDARLMILSNELPKLADSSGALASRMLVLQLKESFLGREDIGLTGRLCRELPSILKWSITGWDRLYQRGRFTQPTSGLDLAGEMAELTSPISRFIGTCCKVGFGFMVRKSQVYEVWRAWCELNGIDHPGDIATFGRNLRAALPQITDSQPREKTDGEKKGKRVESYAGIKLNESATDAQSNFREIQKKGGAGKFSQILRQWLDAADDESENSSLAGDESFTGNGVAGASSAADGGMIGGLLSTDSALAGGLSTAGSVTAGDNQFPQHQDCLDPTECGSSGSGYLLSDVSVNKGNTEGSAIYRSPPIGPMISWQPVPSGATTAKQYQPSDESPEANWLDSVPLTTVSRCNLLVHKSPSCGACRGWRLRGGDLYCFSCWPPVDRVGVDFGLEQPVSIS